MGHILYDMIVAVVLLLEGYGNGMRRLREILVCLGVGLAFNAGASMNDAAATDDHYSSIALRNVFGLNPPGPAPVAVTPVSLPPKITLNGIMSIFGESQVLFKVGGTGPAGHPIEEISCILNDHESRDGISVIRIDVVTRTVTFNNHGAVQQISLGDTPKGAVPMLAAAAEPAPVPEVNLPKTYPPEFVKARTPDYLGGGPDASTNDLLVAASQEDRILLIEAQRAYLKSRGDPAADLLPATALTPPDAFAPKGN